jgi:hypothetical protein
VDFRAFSCGGARQYLTLFYISAPKREKLQGRCGKNSGFPAANDQRSMEFCQTAIAFILVWNQFPE